MTHQLIQEAVYAVLQQFVERQKIVLVALQNLRPDFFMPPKDYPRDEWQKLRCKYSQAPTTGLWGKHDEWAYRLHGIGCHLTHIETGEVIGWDVGNIKRFDMNWFADYLKWFVQYIPESEQAKRIMKYVEVEDNEALQAFVKHVLEQLETENRIAPAGYRRILL